MNTVLTEILETGTVKSADGSGSKPLDSAISPSEGEFLQQIIRRLDPVVSLEVGLAQGISALFICDALSENTRQHIVIDPYQYQCPWEGIGMANLRRAGHAHRIRFIEEPSHRALADLERHGERIDFAFIDGHHAFDFALVDFFFIDRMLRPGGILVFDDAGWPAVRKVCRFIRSNRKYTVIPGPLSVRRESFKRRMAEGLGETLARIKPLGRLIHPEFVSDRTLGLEGSCIGFRKDADDEPLWTHFVDF